MRTRHLFSVLAGTTLFALAGPAVAQQATPVPDKKPDFSTMAFQLGTWTCKTLKNTMGRGAGRVETDVNTMSEDGNYMETDTTSKPFDAARTRTFTSKGWMGYDTARKAWYAVGISNFGGFGISTSPGWVGNKMIWTDTYATDGSPLGVGTYTKLSDTKTTNSYTVKTPHGTETTLSECTKD